MTQQPYAIGSFGGKSLLHKVLVNLAGPRNAPRECVDLTPEIAEGYAPNELKAAFSERIWGDE